MKFKNTYENGVETIWIEGHTGSRLIEGTCSTPKPATSGIGNKLCLSSKGAMAKLPIPLMSEHAKGVPVGQVFYLRKAPDGIFIRASVDESEEGDHLWNLIESGECRSFSVLACDQVQGAKIDNFQHVTRWRIGEVSVCREGANSDCKFAVVGRTGFARDSHNSKAMASRAMASMPLEFKNAAEYQRWATDIMSYSRAVERGEA